MPNLAIHPDLLAVLACPDTDHAPLILDPDGASLTCTGCGHRYPVVDGIPVLLLGGPPHEEAGRA